MVARAHIRSFVDVHAHVVAGIDDGPVDDGETDALLDALAAQGATTVVTTPHVDARFDGAPDDLAVRVRALRNRRPEAPGVLAGAEVHPGRLDDVIAAGAHRFTLGGGGTLLVEAATDGPAVNVARLDIDDLIAAIDLRLADLVAHPDEPHLGPPILRRSAR